jgi:hypothetical protein
MIATKSPESTVGVREYGFPHIAATGLSQGNFCRVFGAVPLVPGGFICQAKGTEAQSRPGCGSEAEPGIRRWWDTDLVEDVFSRTKQRFDTAK